MMTWWTAIARAWASIIQALSPAPLGLARIFRYYDAVNPSQNKIVIHAIIPARD